MTANQQLQRILDHFQVGKILGASNHAGSYQVETSQGQFVVIEHPAEMDLDDIRAGEKRWADKLQGMEQLLLPDYTGTHTPETSYVHQNDRYYSVYGKKAR